MATKSRHDIFSLEHPRRGAEAPPDPTMRAYLALVPSPRLWKAQLHCEGQEPPAWGSAASAQQHSRVPASHMAPGHGAHLALGSVEGSADCFIPRRSHLVNSLLFSATLGSSSPR